MQRRDIATPKVTATKTAQLARFLSLVALHKQEAGHRVAQAREAAGMTQQQASEMVGVDRRTIQRYEAGEIGRMAVIQQLADAYGMSVEEMLGGEEFTTRASPISERLDRIEAQLREVLDQQAELLATLSEVRSEQEHLRPHEEPDKHGRGETGN